MALSWKVWSLYLRTELPMRHSRLACPSFSPSHIMPFQSSCPHFFKAPSAWFSGHLTSSLPPYITLFPTSLDISVSESAASINPLHTQDYKVCVTPNVLASNQVRRGDTICLVTLNKRSHSADMGGIESKSRAIRDSWGYLFPLSYQYRSRSVTSRSFLALGFDS